LLSAALKEYPGLVDVMKNRHKNYNATLRHVLEAEKDGRALVICPPEPLPVKRLTHDRKKLEATYETGRAAALLRLDEIKEFLK
jgi:predicted patatin/cPLA2 family phospholipase